MQKTKVFYSLNKDKLIKLYIDESLTTQEIANKFGVSRSTVTLRIRHFKIRLKDYSNGKKLYALKMSRINKTIWSQIEIREKQTLRLRENNPMQGKHHSKKTKMLISEIKKENEAWVGENNPNWKGGVSAVFSERHGIPQREWMKLAEQVRARDNDVCQYCGKCFARDVHHLIPYSRTQDNSLENLITLCKSCHRIVEGRTTLEMQSVDEVLSSIFYSKWGEQII